MSNVNDSSRQLRDIPYAAERLFGDASTKNQRRVRHMQRVGSLITKKLPGVGIVTTDAWIDSILDEPDNASPGART